MSNRTERPTAWPSRLMSWLVGDPWRKIVAILLAIFLYNQIDREISGEQEIQVYLTGRFGRPDEDLSRDTLRLNVPKEFMIIDFINRASPLQPELVRVTLSGPRKSLPRTRGVAYLNLNHQIDLNDNPSPEYESLDLAEIIGSKLPTGDLSVQCDPPTIRVRIARIEERSLRLRPDFLGEPSAQPPEGYRWIRDQVIFDPSTISIRGPSPFVSTFEDEIREKGSLFQSFSLTNVTFTDSRLLSVGDWLDDFGITANPESVTVTLPIEDEMDPIPIQLSVKDLSILHYPQDAEIILESDPESVTVTLQVPRVLTDRFDLEPDSPQEVLAPFLEYFVFYVDAGELSIVENTTLLVRVQALDHEIAANNTLEDLLPAFRRVRLAGNPGWVAERKTSD